MSVFELKDKIAIVTGGGTGIGKSIATEFAKAGANVVVASRKMENLESTVADIKALGRESLAIVTDVRVPEQVNEMVKQTMDKFGRLDILVNNAASGVQRPAAELEQKHWDWAMNINARAPWLCAIEASRLMSEGGKIVNITSPGSRRVLPNYFSVGTSKAAMEAVTRYLAVELAPNGISVNAVSAGYVETGALDHFPNREEMLAAGQRTPAGRMLTGDDIAKVVAFLCADQAEMVRGQVIVVDGGASLLSSPGGAT